jgi:hypothetical protein
MFLEQPVLMYPVKQLATFHGTGRFRPVFTTARHWMLPHLLLMGLGYTSTAEDPLFLAPQHHNTTTTRQPVLPFTLLPLVAGRRQ